MVGIDGSEAGSAAAAIAGWIAGAVGSHLRLVSVVEELPPYVSARREQEADRVMARRYYGDIQRVLVARLQRRGVVVDSDLRYGNEANGLLDAATAFEADLIALGHAGNSGVWAGGLGSTSGRVVQAAGTSVLVARGGAANVDRFLVAFDGSPDSTQALEVAVAIARPAGAAVVIAASPHMAVTRDPRHSLDSLMARLGTGITWSVEVVKQDPAQTIVALARDGQHRLVVVGAHGLRHPWAPGIGPVALQVLERAESSVLVVRPPSGVLTAGRLMRPNPISVTPETPIGMAAERLLDLGIKCLPVVDEDGRPVGILTLGDLLRRARFGVRNSLMAVLTNDELQLEIGRLADARTACEAVMSGDVATIRTGSSIAEVLAEMVGRSIKRLLVVDDAGKLIGIVSRSDVLRALAGSSNGHDVAARRQVTGRVARDVMQSQVVTVSPDDPGDEVARAVLGSGIGRVAVVDGRGHLVGVVATRDLLPLATAETRPHLVAALTGQPGRIEAFLSERRRHPQAIPTASDLMRRDPVTVEEEAPLAEVLRVMMSRDLKRILVLGTSGRVVGAVDRADVVRGLAASGGSGSAR